MAMMRMRDEDALENFLKTSTARIARPLVTKAAAPVLSAPSVPSLSPVPRRMARGDEIAGRTPAAAAPKESDIERRFAQQIRAAGLPDPEREYYHITGRDFRLDFAWPAIKLGVEVQGMAHRIKGKFHADMEKRILAQMNGWLVMEISGDMVRHDTAIAWLVILMGQRRQQ